jgi:hypothetical protein
LTSNMQVVEIFLPVRFPDGTPIPAGQLELVQSELAELFGGVTAYSRSPAVGEWKHGQNVERDLMVIFEVMVGKIDEEWWSSFGGRLKATFRQQEVLIRSHKVSRL